MPKTIFKVKAVIFDMDGVITNTMPDHYHAWRDVLKNQGVHVTYLDIYSREGQRGLQSVKEIFQKYNKAYDLKLAKQMLKKKEALFKKIAKRRFVVGARLFLKKLYAQGFQLGLVTGTSRHELHRILPKELFDLFSVTVTGSDVKKGKPHPEPFRKCLKQLKIKHSDAVVIENAPLGIQAAKMAKLDCIALETSLPRGYLKQADIIVKTYHELDQRVHIKVKSK